MGKIEDLDNLIEHGDYQKIATLYNALNLDRDKKTNRDYVRKVLKGRRNNEEILSFAKKFFEKRTAYEKSLKEAS